MVIIGGNKMIKPEELNNKRVASIEQDKKTIEEKAEQYKKDFIKKIEEYSAVDFNNYKIQSLESIVIGLYKEFNNIEETKKAIHKQKELLKKSSFLLFKYCSDKSYQPEIRGRNQKTFILFIPRQKY